MHQLGGIKEMSTVPTMDAKESIMHHERLKASAVDTKGYLAYLDKMHLTFIFDMLQ